MIVIIGAGISGLTCAKYLKDKGEDFVILEASESIGGRVKTDNIEGFKLDHGFQVFSNFVSGSSKDSQLRCTRISEDTVRSTHQIG